jgi:hypothetical protein
MLKDKWITIRLSAEEKEQMNNDAKEAGFDSISTYLLWLYRQQRKNKA